MKVCNTLVYCMVSNSRKRIRYSRNGPAKAQMIRRRVTFSVDVHNDSEEPTDHRQMKEELQDLLDALQSGTAFILGHSHVERSLGLKRLAINFAYHFLRRNCRGPDVVLKVARASLLEVGMVYVV
ncbi:putative potassium transporter [Helianthus anomalus]